LEYYGHTVESDLNFSPYDIILVTNSISKGKNCSYPVALIKLYLIFFPKTIVIQRINSCDARHDTNYEDDLIIYTNKLANHTIFISNFIKDYFARIGLIKSSNDFSIIKNGADTNVFNPVGFSPWPGPPKKIKIVTHHWSSNYKKGFDIYCRLDRLLDDPYWSSRFEFCYIGNIPKDQNLSNTKILSPLSGIELGSALKINHLYLTASRFEPAGMHHIEAMQCGLPILFIESGALPDYCSNYGISFKPDNFLEKLEFVYNNYSEIFKMLPKCDYSSTHMADEYRELFLKLASENMIKERSKNLLSKFIFYTYKYILKKNYRVR